MVVLDPKVKKILILAVIGTVLIVVLVFLFIGRIGSIGRIGRIDATPTPTPSVAVLPTPLPIAPGKQVYSVRTDSNTPGPAITEATFDPLDVSKGGKITVSVKASNAASVSVTMIDDSGKNPHELALSNTLWSGSWTVESTHTRIYGATIEAINKNREKRTVELWFR